MKKFKPEKRKQLVRKHWGSVDLPRSPVVEYFRHVFSPQRTPERLLKIARDIHHQPQRRDYDDSMSKEEEVPRVLDMRLRDSPRNIRVRAWGLFTKKVMIALLVSLLK